MKCEMIVSPAGEGPGEQDIECVNEAALVVSGVDTCVECAEEMAKEDLLSSKEREQLAEALEARAAKGGR